MYYSKKVLYNLESVLGMSFSREKRENEEFNDEKFLTRKQDEKNEKLTGLK